MRNRLVLCALSLSLPSVIIACSSSSGPGANGSPAGANDAGQSGDKDASAGSPDAAGNGGGGDGGGHPVDGSVGGTDAGSSIVSYPLVKPPVLAATPAGLGGSAKAHARGHLTPFALDPTDIKQRFFGAGPTDIFQILNDIDGRIQGANTEAKSGNPCFTQTPVAYNLTPLGQTIPAYAQCYQSIPGPDGGTGGFIQFGTKDGITYLYSTIGQAHVAAILTPAGGALPSDAGAPADSSAATDADGTGDAGGSSDAGSTADATIGSDASIAPDASLLSDAASGPPDASASADDGGTTDAGVAASYFVHAWMGVGYLNATSCGNMNGFDDCSYGMIELQADPSHAVFEMAVAGIGFGYCGAQLKSDGIDIYVTGSTDMGSCNATDSLCVAASDGTTPATCGASTKTFALTPMGRMETTGPNAAGPGNPPNPSARWGASAYPGDAGDTVLLNGTATDSLSFGPSSPTAGVGSL